MRRRSLQVAPASRGVGTRAPAPVGVAAGMEAPHSAVFAVFLLKSGKKGKKDVKCHFVMVENGGAQC